MKKIRAILCSLLFSFAGAEAAEFMPERPDAPDNAVSIGKGEFYYETEVLAFNDNGDQSDYTLMQPTIRYGVTDHVEVLLNQGGLNKTPGNNMTFKDFFPRVRWNHIGNEGGDFQLSTIYGVNLPAENESSTDWMIYAGVPFAFVLPDDYYLAGTISYSEGRDREERADYNYVTHSWALFQGFHEALEFFVQVFGDIAMDRDAQNKFSWGGGVVWKPVENLQLDFYINDGLSGAAPDINPAFGVAKKF